MSSKIIEELENILKNDIKSVINKELKNKLGIQINHQMDAKIS
jgi:hypothetical protein